MKRNKNMIFLLMICLNLSLFCCSCDFAPASIQSGEKEDSFEMVTEEKTTFQSTAEKTTSEKRTQENQPIYVHVCGCVKNPGVYELSSDARAEAAVKAAGGMTKEADEKQVNLAQILQDGTQLYVPSKEEQAGQVSEIKKQETADNHSIPGSQNVARININSATIEELTTLSGIGESRAKAIVEYRETKGLFSTIEDIKNVSGIGDSIYEKIKDDITV